MTFDICHVNTRSLLGHFDQFKDFFLDNEFHFIGVTESWLHADIDDNLVRLDNYNSVRNDRVDRRGGGVIVYIRKGFKFEVILRESQDFIEIIWVKVFVKKETFIIATIYRPPNTDSSAFFSTFEDTLIDIYATYDNIFCLGDFNINMLNVDSTLTSNLLTLIEPLNLVQIMDEPTRITESTASLIDLILTNSENITGKGTIDCPFSDHLIIFCQVKCTMENKRSDNFSYRSLKNIDFDLFQRDLEVIPFETIYNMENVDQKIEFLTNNLLALYDLHAPLRTINKRTRPFAPWITYNIKLMQKLRDRALKEFKSTKLPAKWAYYKQLRNLTTTAIRSEKKAYYRQKFQTSSVKEKWKELNRLKPSKTVDIPEKFHDTNKLNSFFIQSTNSNIRPNNELLNFYLSNVKDNITQLLSFKIVTDLEIQQIIQRIKSKAFGSDKLNITLIHLCCPYIIKFITHIINECILKSYFPRCWKSALVTPMPKVNNPSEFSQFRSISILPALSKILERVMEEQTRVFINNFNILPLKQSGFRPGFSCATALADITDDIISDRDNNKITALILLDYTKAFDFLNHEILISILHYVGFSQNAVGLISSFLSDRTQRVIINKDISDSLDIHTGVPQGSILGPLLFSIYTSNFHACLKTCRFHLYADDTQLYLSFSPRDFAVAETNINTDLNALFKVSSDHMLKLNPTKSLVLLLGNGAAIDGLKNIMHIRIENNDLPFVQKCKSLGIILDSELRFKLHVNYILKKAYSSLKALYPLRHFLDRDIKKLLCDSLVLSHFNHCDNVYGPCLDAADVHRIQRVQNNCLRLIFGIRRRNRISHKLKDLYWLNMVNRRKLHATCLYYKILKFRSPPYLYNKITFRTDVHHLNLRRKNINIPKHKHEFFKRSFSYNVALLINSLDLDLAQINMSSNSFKYKLNKILFNNQCHGQRL